MKKTLIALCILTVAYTNISCMNQNSKKPLVELASSLEPLDSEELKNLVGRRQEYIKLREEALQTTQSFEKSFGDELKAQSTIKIFTRIRNYSLAGGLVTLGAIKGIEQLTPSFSCFRNYFNTDKIFFVKNLCLLSIFLGFYTWGASSEYSHDLEQYLKSKKNLKILKNLCK
jgi:hypothetical protein